MTPHTPPAPPEGPPAPPHGPAPITVLGRGPHPLPPGDAALLAAATLVAGARRHLEAAPVPARARRVVLGPLAPALDAVAAEAARDGGRVVVLASGDPGFFGVVRALGERFGPRRLEVRPDVPSVAAAFARLGLPWDDAVVVSAHGRAPHTAYNVCRAHRKAAVLTAPGAGPAEIGAALLRTPGVERRLVVASDLGGPDERVEEVPPAEAAARTWPGVNLVLCLGPGSGPEGGPGGMRTLAGAPPAPAGWALPEDAFEHRDSMVTKAEVRALALARLGPHPGALVWDVGAGSGSVAVECARLGAAAVAVERTADGAARIAANARAHGVDVSVVHGEAPRALAALPDPDAVFVGGGGAALPAVVAACAARARRTVVVTLAAVDRVPAVRAALRAAGLEDGGVLLQSSRLAPLPGDVVRLAAANPVFVLWGHRPGAPRRQDGVLP
ncbi:precorrin-6y C5,15-methyltransferase (decarboxylating) subunit CbiE [Streptacidiphilus sp. ASG 303]|uniref:precorrin-6y C5,15-methyltransferase (decarboxylating) subunit CbiE n=1 Tax=Streptacidiphilus sp. ASG 303 TaxID=2896847 RepID=UPI001E31A620|nr:precorrin-6y C5,15-methyltransferase (decarboxylating) subunit CbiE [Streptacidiphilus sp. ASG 303]MCD0483170.1 precorrin-6y C5,15-methyltransferase (decarboxylating) subunit CbiE [Streptacidiphilus sp. ASG 303]